LAEIHTNRISNKVHYKEHIIKYTAEINFVNIATVLAKRTQI